MDSDSLMRGSDLYELIEACEREINMMQASSCSITQSALACLEKGQIEDVRLRMIEHLQSQKEKHEKEFKEL